jgi:hypothetical protein
MRGGGAMTDRERARRLAEVAAELAALAADLAEPDIKPQADEPRPRDGDQLLTAEQVALALGVDVGSLARRRFPFRVKIGHRTYRYSEVGLRRWMKNGGSS